MAMTYQPTPRTASQILVGGILSAYILSAVLVSQLSWGANLSQGIGMLLAFVFALSLLAGRGRIQLSRELIVLVMFAASTVVGGLVARSLSDFIELEGTLFQIVILSVIVYNVSQDEASRVVAMRVFVAAVVVASILSALGVNFYALGGRSGSVLVNPNSYGAVLLLAIALASYLLVIRARRWERLALIAVIPWLSWNVVLSGSRTAILGLVVFLLALFLFYACRRARSRPFRVLVAGLVLLGVLSAGVLLVYRQEALQRRFQALWGAVSAGEMDIAGRSLALRYGFFRVALQVWYTRPLFGVGANQFQDYVLEYDPGLKVAYAHSDYAEILTDFGLTGFVLYYMVYFFIIARIVKLRKWRSPGKYGPGLDVLLAFFAAFLVTEIGSITYYDKNTWIVVVLLLCAVQGLRKKAGETKQHVS